MKAKILIAEDDANIRLGLIATLESEGYAVVAAADGALIDFARSPTFLTLRAALGLTVGAAAVGGH